MPTNEGGKRLFFTSINATYKELTYKFIKQIFSEISSKILTFTTIGIMIHDTYFLIILGDVHCEICL